jgi:hypothetical protein
MVDENGNAHPTGLSASRRTLRTWTFTLTALTAATLLIYDWDKSQGHVNAFSGIRPALRSAFNKVYGVERGRP